MKNCHRSISIYISFANYFWMKCRINFSVNFNCGWKYRENFEKMPTDFYWKLTDFCNSFTRDLRSTSFLFAILVRMFRSAFCITFLMFLRAFFGLFFFFIFNTFLAFAILATDFVLTLHKLNYNLKLYTNFSECTQLYDMILTEWRK